MTDKSRSVSVDTPANYVQAMSKHTKNDKKLSQREIEKMEKELNGHAIMYARFLKMGKKWNHEDRIKQAITNDNGPIPQMFGLRKDHKITPPEKKEEGPPTRPVCAASASLNGPLSHIISKVLNHVADKMDETINTECRSTEEMIAEFENINDQEIKEITVWSSDVKALYPSFKVEVVAKVVAEEFRKSDIDIEVDTDELGLYLTLVVYKDRIKEMV